MKKPDIIPLNDLARDIDVATARRLAYQERRSSSIQSAISVLSERGGGIVMAR